jgi:hypothetical protein
MIFPVSCRPRGCIEKEVWVYNFCPLFPRELRSSFHIILCIWQSNCYGLIMVSRIVFLIWVSLLSIIQLSLPQHKAILQVILCIRNFDSFVIRCPKWPLIISLFLIYFVALYYYHHLIILMQSIWSWKLVLNMSLQILGFLPNTFLLIINLLFTVVQSAYWRHKITKNMFYFEKKFCVDFYGLSYSAGKFV